MGTNDWTGTKDCDHGPRPRIGTWRVSFADVGRIVVAAVAGTGRVRGGEEVAGAPPPPVGQASD